MHVTFDGGAVYLAWTTLGELAGQDLLVERFQPRPSSGQGVRARLVRRTATASASSPSISTVSSQPMQASVMLWP